MDESVCVCRGEGERRESMHTGRRHQCEKERESAGTKKKKSSDHIIRRIKQSSIGPSLFFSLSPPLLPANYSLNT